MISRTMKLPRFIKKRIDTRKTIRLTLEDKRKLVNVIEHRQKEEEKEAVQEPAQQDSQEEKTGPEANNMETKTNVRLEGTEEENVTPQQRKNVPLIETHISRSKDGRYIIHRTVITDIKPTGYYEKILEANE